MLQLLQNLGNGQTTVVDVPAPGSRPGALLIVTTRSLISAGTERMLVDFGKAGWIGKARQQPEKVRAVINKVRANGLAETVRAIRSKLQQPIPLGYCQVGRVVDDGRQTTDNGQRTTDRESSFRAGDRVVSNGPHAEVVSVVHDLCAKIPDAVNDEAATFTPLAAIALQGINLLGVRPGEKVVVTGLGLIGQLAVRVLKAQGCDVLGLDPAPERRALAERSGARTASGDPVAAALAWTLGQGVAGVLITASTASNEVVNQAARSCRHRGKVVLVGVVGLQLNRADFYRNEVSFQVSCSYGARDARSPSSARGNFERVLGWMAEGRLPVEDLISHRHEFKAAASAYAALADRAALGVMMTYGDGKQRTEGGGQRTEDGRQTTDNGRQRSEDGGRRTDDGRQRTDDGGQRMDDGRVLNRTIILEDGREKAHTAQEASGAGVAFIGAGNFATRSLLPAMQGLATPPVIRAVASNLGASALLAARTCGARYATTDTASLLADPAVSAVFITTRHNLHASQAMAALQAGKHVWVEKPLCLNLEDLRQIENIVLGSDAKREGQGAGTSDPRSQTLDTKSKSPAPTLMVGFNRRFAPLAVALRDVLEARPGAHRFVMTVNAGRLDPDHWTLDPRIGGGRIVGEACHFVDLMRFLVGQPILDVRCVRRDRDGQDGGAFELRFPGGTSGLIDYRTDLPAHLPKEVIEVSGEGFSATIDNWVRLRSQGLGGLGSIGFWNRRVRKGHPEALRAFFASVSGGPEPISLAEVLEVSRWSIAMQAMQEPEADDGKQTAEG